MSKRKIVESPVGQGVDESIAYILDTTNGPGSGAITSESVVLKDELGNDVSATHLSGATSVSSAEITSKTVANLVAGVFYRLEFLWTQNTNVFESFLDIEGEE